MALPTYVGRYAVRGQIAHGGFAVVVLAWDEELDAAVALKILDCPQDGMETTLQTRFINEARMLRRIRSHHVVTVHDVGRLNDGRPYFVMDFADRGTLADWLDGQRAARPGEPPAVGTHELAALADALADGLGAIHRAGIVHRDIKPANILFQSIRPSSVDPKATIAHSPRYGALPHQVDSVFDDARILVGDLGIAKDVIQDGAEATLIAGTPAYQAPEQLDPDEPVTAATDIYAATAVLYHTITGSKPPRPDREDDFFLHIPAGWLDVIRRGLARDPCDRFASIESWRVAVHDVLAEMAAESSSDRHEAVADPADSPVSADCPYKGLSCYQPEDADRFFGREALTEELVRRLHTHNVLVVGGPSGSGKSSLVRAGMIPALKVGAAVNSGGWRFALMTPGRDAMAELYYQLVQSLDAASHSIGPNDLMARPTLARRLAHPTGSEPTLVLCIDQFEELFTLSPVAQRDAFIEALSAMTDPADSRVRVVIAVRADYYATCAQIPWLAERITDNQVLVGPMSPAELRRAITEPARQAGLYLERNLIDQLIEDAGSEAGSLPLVAHALVETWMRRKGATLTLEGYRAAGGVAGSIAQTAEAIFEKRFTPEEQEATRRLFLRLVTPGEGAGDTRRIVERSEIEADSAQQLTARLINRLTHARLLTVDKRHVQIAHEALLRSWPRLRRWIDEVRDELRTRQRLIRHAEEWHAADYDRDLLLRGTPLLTAIDWRAKNPDQGTALLEAYLDASAEEKARAEATARERGRRTRQVRRATVAALSILAAGATVASVVAYFGYRDAHQNEIKAAAATRQADARFALALGAVAAGLADDDPRLALYLAGEAMARTEGEPAGYDARAAMIAARRHLTHNGPFLLGSPIPVGDALSLAIAPDGALLAVGGRNGSIMVIDTATRRPVGAPVAGHDGGVEDIEFSPDGRSLATAGNDGIVRLWPVKDGFLGTGIIIAQLDDVVWGLGFDATGNRLATAGEDQTVRVWNTKTGAQVGAPMVEGIGDVLSVAFSPDGKGLIAGLGSGAIYGWLVSSGEPLMPVITDVHTSDVWGLVFAPAGDRFATASSDRSSALFAYPEGRFLGRAFDASESIHSVVFTPDGSGLLGGGEDGRVHLRSSTSDAQPTVSAPGHTGRILEVAISGDGRLLASLGRDHTVRLWTLYNPVGLSIDRNVATGAAKGAAISADGTIVAAAEETGLVHVWQEDAMDPKTFAGHDHQVWALAISPDGHTLASGDRSGEIRFWDMVNGEPKHGGDTADGAVWWLGFGPGGERLFATNDRGVDILDVNTGRKVGHFAFASGQVTRGAVSPDGKFLAATTSDGRVRLFDLEANSIWRDIDILDDVVWSVAFSRNGRLLAVASSDESVSIWSVTTGDRQATLGGHSGGATDVAFLSDGATLAVVDRRGNLHVWDVTGGRRLAPPIAAHQATSWRLATASRANIFVTSGDDGKVRLWDFLSIERACKIGGPAFDRERRRQYFGEDVHSLACTGG